MAIKAIQDLPKLSNLPRLPKNGISLWQIHYVKSSSTSYLGNEDLEVVKLQEICARA